MKIETAIEIGKNCGLTTVEECIGNIDIHAGNIFPYSEITKELNELYNEYYSQYPGNINTNSNKIKEN